MSLKKRSTRVFHVEDSAKLRNRIAHELAELDGVALVGWAGGAAEAIAQIHKIRPDLVVLDLQLLPGSGLDVLRELRRGECPPAVIVLTNQSDSVSREWSLKAGAQGFFDKSTELESFMSAIKQFILS